MTQPDADVDLLVFGAGMGGMCAALFGALEKLDVLLCEKSGQVGGTTSTSAGTLWIPGSSQAERAGVGSTLDSARQYLDAEIGAPADAVREAFLSTGRAALDRLEADTDVKFRAPPIHPDYHSNQPGRVLAGRALAPFPFDGRLLGADFARVRPPIPPFMVLGGMMVGKDDIAPLLRPFGSWTSLRAAMRLLLRHATDRLRGYARGTRLVMGNALVARLFYSLRQKNVPVWFDATLVELTVSGGEATGAVVDVAGRRRVVHARRGVVLATGGFASSETLRREFMKGAPVAHSNAVDEATGDGLSLARGLGAAIDTKHRNPAFYFPSSSIKDRGEEILFPHIILDRSKPGLIAVNSSGRRFVNEAGPYHDFGAAMLNAHKTVPTLPAYLICDSDFLRDYGLGLIHPRASRRRIGHFIKSGYLMRAETIGDLARLISADAKNLAATVAEHNRFAASGADEAFGRGSGEFDRLNGDPANAPNPCMRPIAAAPFFAVAVYPSAMGTSIGLATDADARVLDGNGRAIEGLYACGNDASSLFRGVYVGPGITLGPALVFAYRAVQHIKERA